MILPPGTPTVGTDRTVEQNETIQFILAKNANQASPKYSGWLILPDGTLTNNREYLTIPTDRALEIETALSAGTDPELVSEPGNVLLLDTNGIPFQYVKVQSITGAIDSQSATDIINEPDVDDTVYLDQMVLVNNSTIVRQYTKGSGTAIIPATIELTNTSDISIHASVDKIPGIVYTPSELELLPNVPATIQLSFDVSVIESLPEGITTYTTIINLTTANSTPAVGSQTPPTPPTTPTPSPVGGTTTVPLPPDETGTLTSSGTSTLPVTENMT